MNSHSKLKVTDRIAPPLLGLVALFVSFYIIGIYNQIQYMGVPLSLLIAGGVYYTVSNHERIVDSIHKYRRRRRERREQRRIPSEKDELTTQPETLATLRERYARGELTDEQFERKLDRLLETETPESAAEWRTDEREHESE